MAKTVAVLGTGIMGSGMARNLVEAGFDVTVWNRSPEKAKPLGDVGAKVAENPEAAVVEADFVITMLFDEDAVSEVMQRALSAMRTEAVWIQSATVGVDAVVRLAAKANQAGIAYVDAPVLGTRQPAEEGTLTVLAGCPTELRPAVEPVFDAVGARTVWVGEKPGDGQRLKLVVNSWVLSIVGATAQAVDFARSQGLDPAVFFETIAGGGTDCAYAQLKGKAMIAGEFPPAFPLEGAAKDASLISDAMQAVGTSPVLMEALRVSFEAAADAGHAEEDMAAVVTAFHV
ncbi:NAD(P)-dependent oxidoreductase [Sinomonas albida]|uniref:NAD(P)-dependent oxidoreductase n=1 Tax=Sinomonas albida TaxID=369942 RepID=UPI0010A75673|nr:NAD(P)-dependent oxidoreductase [Sinomonas albida]